ncbi:hypothetical protein LIER_07263 [Lithospermum erythrorhizon]|uniref:Uncharacterized protein n=1 Tax=Lithospermum erythrorhizon TaxID=34254 RepID=A0AAV3PBB4_LITER
MDFQGVERSQWTTKSFRNEDYNNRRAFLRSYPLHMADESVGNNNETTNREVMRKRRKQMRKIILAILEWKGEKIIVLRRLKLIVQLYVYLPPCWL